MKKVFVDTSDIIAILHPRDQLHEKALQVEIELGKVQKVTTELVLIEVLNYFCEFRADIKNLVVMAVNRYLTNGKVEIIPCSSKQFQDGFNFYAARLDKGYSLTDCVSMIIMREQNINDILTNDNHFEQEGFRILL